MYPGIMEPFAVAALLTGIAVIIALIALAVVLTIRVRTARRPYDRTDPDAEELFAEFDSRA